MSTDKRSVWLIVGEDDFLRREAQASIEDKVDRDLDRSVFWAGEAIPSAHEIVNLARTPPLIGKARLIIVHDVERFSSSDQDLLLAYVRSPHKDTRLVLLSRKMKEDDFLFGLKRHVSVVAAGPLYEEELPRWLNARAALFKKRLTQEALELLIERIGNNPSSLADAIDRIAIYAGERRDIARRDVEIHTGRSRIETGFALADAVSRRSAGDALRISATLVREGEEVLEIIGLLGWHFRRLLRAKRYLQEGASRARLAQELHIGQYFLDKFLTQVKGFTEEELHSKLEFLLEKDVGIKMGREGPESALSFLLVELSR